MLQSSFNFFSMIHDTIWQFRAALTYMQYMRLNFIDAWDIAGELRQDIGTSEHPVKMALVEINENWDYI